MNRRGFLSALLAAGAAPAIVRAESLMKIVVPEKKILVPNQNLTWHEAEWQYEPGQFNGHDWVMVEGGPRFDRHIVLPVAAAYLAKR